MSMISVISGSGRSVPGAPTIGTATDVGSGRTFVSGGRADVTFTAPTYTGRVAITSYTVKAYDSAGVYQSISATGASSPISVTGLTPGVQYKYAVYATNSIGNSAESGFTSLVTATTIPQVPTITSATRSSNTVVSIAFTGSNGGSTITAITATSSPSVSISSSGTSSPMTATATYAQGTSYTFTITATNANGTSTASNTSGSVTPYPQPALGAWTAGATWPINTFNTSAGNGNGVNWWVGGGYRSSPSSASTNLGYYWNGTGFTQQNYPVVSVWMGNNRVTSTSSNSLMFVGGYNYGSATYSQSTYTWDTSGFLARSNYGVNALLIGFGALGNNGPVRGVGGENSAGNSYYASTLGGAWSSAGVSTPFSSNNVPLSGVDNNFGGQVWYFAQANNTPYRVTSTTSGYTAMTNRAWSGTENDYALGSVVNGNVILMPNTGTATPYLFNGTTYTAQTAWPVANLASALAGGASDATTYRLVRSNQGTTYHYYSTLA